MVYQNISTNSSRPAISSYFLSSVVLISLLAGTTKDLLGTEDPHQLLQAKRPTILHPQRQSPNRDPTPAEAALSSGATGYGPAHNTNLRHPTNMPPTGYSSDPNHCGTKPKTTQPKKQTGGGHKPRYSNPTQSFNQHHGTINRPPPPVTAQIRSPPRSLMSLTFHRPPTPSTTQAAPTHQATLEQPPPTETGELPNASDKQNNM